MLDVFILRCYWALAICNSNIYNYLSHISFSSFLAVYQFKQTYSVIYNHLIKGTHFLFKHLSPTRHGVDGTCFFILQTDFDDRVKLMRHVSNSWETTNVNFCNKTSLCWQISINQVFEASEIRPLLLVPLGCLCRPTFYYQGSIQHACQRSILQP